MKSLLAIGRSPFLIIGISGAVLLLIFGLISLIVIWKKCCKRRNAEEGGDEDSSCTGRKRLNGEQRKTSVSYESPTSIDSKEDQYATLDREQQQGDRAAYCSPTQNETHSYLVLDDEADDRYETVRDANDHVAPNSRHIDLRINITSDKNIVYKVIS